MSELISELPPALKTHASWLINAGAEDTRQSLSQMTGTPDEIRMLKAAIATEKAKPKHQQRSSRLTPMEAKLRKFATLAESEPHSSPPRSDLPVPSSEVEIVTAAQVNEAELSGIAAAVAQSREIIFKHEQSCHETTLEHYLDAGQQLARAQEIFTLSPQERTSVATLSRRDNVEELPPGILANRGFSAWLAKEIPTLKRPTAIKYATAFRALELPVTAKPAEIRAKVKTLRHEAGKANQPMPTLAALVKAAPKPPKPEALIVAKPKTSKQLKLEDARETFHNWKAAFDKALKSGHLDHLDKKGLEDLKDFTATVRDRITARLK